jgi:hypothetical protein
MLDNVMLHALCDCFLQQFAHGLEQGDGCSTFLSSLESGSFSRHFWYVSVTPLRTGMRDDKLVQFSFTLVLCGAPCSPYLVSSWDSTLLIK